MATMYAGPANVYTSAFDVQANLIAGYSRNPKKFKFLDAVTITPVEKPQNRFLRIKPEVAGNITSSWNAASRWADGAPLPIQLDGGQKHEWIEFFCERYAQTFPIGNWTEQNAVWNIVESQSEALAGRLQTGLAVDVYTALSTSGNYDTSVTATAAGGGKWDVATSTTRYIQASLSYGVQQINKTTMNGVDAEDLLLVVSPTVAAQMAASAEIADYMAGSPFSAPFLKGEAFAGQYNPMYGNYGLPPVLYGIKVLVDPLVRDTAQLGATSTKSEVGHATEAYLIARQGALSSPAGGSNFSFLHVFRVKDKEMQVQVIDDPVNQRKILVVTDYREVRVVGREAAVRFTAVVD